MYDVVPLFGPLPGGPELIVILAVIVLLFGSNRIPELAHASGRAMGEFRRGREEIEQEIRTATSGERTAVDADGAADADSALGSTGDEATPVEAVTTRKRA